MANQTKANEPSKEDNDFLKALQAAMPEGMPAQRMLAIASQFVGHLIVLQDPRVCPPAMALRIVQENIEQGNHAAMLATGPTAGNG